MGIRTWYDAGNMAVELDADQVAAALGDLKNKTPQALKVAINRTARESRKLMLKEVEERYDLNSHGKKLIQDLKQRSKATNKNLEARLGITRNDAGAFRADLGYFKSNPDKPYMGAAWRQAPEYFTARVLKKNPMKNLSGDGTLSKGFLVKLKSGHIGMVQRDTSQRSKSDYTMSGKERWEPNHKLETMSSPSGSAMHRTIWYDSAADETAELLAMNAAKRVQELIEKSKRKG